VVPIVGHVPGEVSKQSISEPRGAGGDTPRTPLRGRGEATNEGAREYATIVCRLHASFCLWWRGEFRYRWSDASHRYSGISDS